MKKVMLPMMFVTALTMAACCTASVVKTPPARTSLVNVLKADTVALVHRDGDGDIAPYCTGVWVSNDTILTADHCVKAPIRQEIKDELDRLHESDTKENIEKNVEAREDGFEIMYIVDADYTGLWREPKAIYTVKVLKHDTAHDLALLKISGKMPAHPITKIALDTPEVGETISVMGHPSGLAWTYTRGLVSAYREQQFRAVEDEGKEGPYLQVSGEVWKGNSGGGAFNGAGELVGIASFMPPAPNECFFIHLSTIKKFLGRH